MLPDLGPEFPPDWAGTPPAIPAGDFLIWQNYREIAAKRYLSLYFNVRVGEPIFVSNQYSPELRAMAIALSRRRIDVVGKNADGWHLIELKQNADVQPLGQILLYNALWRQDPPDINPVFLYIVSDVIDRGLATACKLYGIKLIKTIPPP